MKKQNLNHSNEPVLLSYNESQYLQNKSIVENFIMPSVQSIVDAYNSLVFEPVDDSTKRPLTKDDFIRLFTEPVDLIFDKMTGGEPVAIAGVKVHKSKAIDILHRPVGYTTFLNKVNEVSQFLKNTGHNISIPVSDVDKWFELTASDVVVMSSAKLSEMQAHQKKYATTERAKKMFAFANAIIENAQHLGIEDELIHNPDGIGKVVAKLFNNPLIGKLQTIDTDTIHKYNSAEYRP